MTKAVKFIIAYVLFFWSIAWRTFALSMATAMLTGVGLAVLAIVRNFPSEFIEVFAPMIGLPITLLVGLFVVSERMMNVKDRITN
ncbi:MAG: hypothetical protein EX271_12265 [Acidimicrobiales bacterium]|nr:hypothetical protein [Hyphomonadaceae bacterium]RZV36403.1 MAG: hypothetical protein EX271_12265 [Acidimicrobiales bacterium]